MSAADFLRDRALKDGLPEYSDIADQLDDYEEMKLLFHDYAKGYTRLFVAMKIIAGYNGDERINTLDKARFLAKEAIKFAEEP
jgi:hypothetical protein